MFVYVVFVLFCFLKRQMKTWCLLSSWNRTGAMNWCHPVPSWSS